MRIIAFLLLSISVAHAQAVKIDSLLKVIQNPSNPDTTVIDSYLTLSQVYWNKNLDSAMTLALFAKNMAQTNNDRIRLGNAYIGQGIVYYFRALDDSAEYFQTKAHDIFKKENHEKGLLRTANNLGLIYNSMGKYKNALKYYLDAIKTAEDLNEHTMLASLYFNTGVVHSSLNQEKEALGYYLKAHRYNEAHERNEFKRLTYLDGIGGSYSLLDMHDSANYFFTKAVALAKKLDQDISLAGIYQNIGSLQLDMGNLDSAYHYYELSRQINERTEDNYLLSLNYQGIAAYYAIKFEKLQEPGLMEKSLEYGLKLVALGNEMNQPERLLNGYDKVWNAHYSLGNYEQALSYHLQYTDLKDSLFSKDQSDQIIAMKEAYEAEKKEQQIAMQQTTLNQQKTQQNALIIGIILLTIIALLVYRSQRLKAKKNKQIEALLKEIHHRVKNNLQVVSSLLNMQSYELKDETMLDTIREGQNRVKAMSLIHQKLYQNDDISAINFEEYATELSGQLASVFHNRDCEIKSDIEGDIRLDIDTAIPIGLILNELISNAYKYAFSDKKEGKINIKLSRTLGNELELEVRDNGKGISPALDLTNSQTLGLKLVNILTKQLKGDWWHRSDEGTSFFIRFKEAAPI